MGHSSWFGIYGYSQKRGRTQILGYKHIKSQDMIDFDIFSLHEEAPRKPYKRGISLFQEISWINLELSLSGFTHASFLNNLSYNPLSANCFLGPSDWGFASWIKRGVLAENFLPRACAPPGLIKVKLQIPGAKSKKKKKSKLLFHTPNYAC
jgi:hypothetical protein